jgi:hypothetical protein
MTGDGWRNAESSVADTIDTVTWGGLSCRRVIPTFPRSADRSHLDSSSPTSGRLIDFAVLSVFGVSTLGIFALIHARALNLPNYIDPWIYTGLFRDWDYMYRVFGDSYYSSRLPYLIPGYVVNQMFAPVTAFYVLHWSYLVLGASAAYLLLTRFYGRVVGAIGYVAMLGNVLYYGAHIDDYYDGAVLAYLLVGLYFLLTARQVARYWLWMTAAGFFLCAAFTTNLFAGVPIACMALLYVSVHWPQLRRRPLQTLAADAAFILLGACLLIGVCGLFSVVKGGRFFYFMTQIRTVGTLNLAVYKMHGYEWLKTEPKLLVSFFLFVAIALLWRRRLITRWSDDPAIRFAVGSVAYLALLFGTLGVWEFAFTGIFFEIPYYFSYVISGFILVLGAAVWVAFQTEPHRSRTVGVVFVLLAAVAAIAPAIAVTRGVPWTAFFTYEHGPRAAVVTMIVVLVLVLLRRFLDRSAAALGATIVGLVLAVNLASATGISGYVFFQTTPTTRDQSRHALDLGDKFIAFMKEHGLQRQDRAPSFWYDINASPMLNAIQSMYLWESTWIGIEMPKLDAQARSLLASRGADTLILLCAQPQCEGGPRVLRHAGYSIRLTAAGLLESGPYPVWVRAYALQQDPATVNYYISGASPLAKREVGRNLVSWSFAKGVPVGWAGASAAAANSAAGRAFATSGSQWNYELVAPRLTLKPGVYHLYASGQVLRGGLDLGVLDDASNNWIEQSFYWYKQPFANAMMETSFTLSRLTKVQFVLSNWVPSNAASTWQVAKVGLTRSAS